MNKNIKIVADSSCDMLELSDICFETAPLKIITANKEYVDDKNLDVYEMVTELGSYKGKSSTSCPNANDWIKAFGDAEEVFCVTITATLSGSYNAAVMAKEMYEEKHPGRRVFVLNSLTAGPEISLIIEKLQELILEDKDFDEICQYITTYRKNTGLLFMLESMKNLANNGRVSPLVAKMAGLLGIRVVGKASDKGDLEPLNKCRGEVKALQTIVEHLKELGLKNGKVRIAHCFNEEAGKQLKELILKELTKVQVQIYKCRGLCSFYAENGGLLVGFERI
ncbi:MAG: DegV family protein [Clostridia bacterium]|nr:DegV family protein [Clostridia bacterium]